VIPSPLHAQCCPVKLIRGREILWERSFIHFRHFISNNGLSVNTYHWPSIFPGNRLQGRESPERATVNKENCPPFTRSCLNERSLVNSKIYPLCSISDYYLLLIGTIDGF